MSLQLVRRDLEKEILTLLSEKTYGLSIEEIAEFLQVNRATAAKYLFAMESTEIIAARPIGKAKLHYLKKNC